MKKVIIGLSVFLLIGILGSAYYFFNNAEEIANDIVRNEFLKKYNESTSSQYLVSVGNIKLNIFTGSFSIQNIKIQPKDSLIVLERNLEGRTLSSTSFNISISEISLLGFDIINALNNRSINAKKFEVSHPTIDIYQHEGITIEEEQVQDTIDLRSILLTSYDSFNLGEVSISDITSTLHKIDSLNDTSLVFNVNHLSYSMYGIYANQQTLYSKYFIDMDRYVLESQNIQVELKNNAHIKLSSIHFDSREMDLIIDDFNFNPNTDPDEYLDQLKYKKGWVDFNTQNITLYDIDIENWFEVHELQANKLIVTNPELKIHTKDDLPFDPNEIKPMLGEMILGLPLPFHVDSTFIENADIKLDIIGKISPVHGKLNLHDMHVTAVNLTNIDRQIQTNPYLIINMQTRLNQTGNVSATLKINLDHASSITQFNLNASHIEFTNFNSVLKPILRVSLTSGKMVDLKINSTLSTNGAFGTMDAHYTGLKMQLEAKDLSKSPGFFNNVASGLANGLIKSDNIPGQQYYHQGKFRFKKTKHDNFFKMLWLITLHGLEDSILGSEHKDEKEKRKKEKESQPKKKLFDFKKSN